VAKVQSNAEAVFRSLGHRIGDVERVIEKGELIKELAEDALDGIEKRTVKGKDAKGNSFAPYAATTKRLRKAKGLQTGHVDLKDTGTMHKATDYRVRSPIMAELWVKPNRKRGVVAKAHNWGVSGRLPRRTWFAVGNLKERLQALAATVLGNAIRDRVIRRRRGGF